MQNVQDNSIRPAVDQSVEQPAAERITVAPKGTDGLQNSADSSLDGRSHGAPEFVTDKDGSVASGTNLGPIHQGADSRRRQWFAYLKTRTFWIVLALSQTLALCQVGCNTLTSLLGMNEFSVPAFQTLFTYILLTSVYTSYTIYKNGFKNWLKLLLKDGWRYFLLGFFDVQGNYFVVLGYRYTNLLSAQLIGYWTLVVVVILSFIFLKVRYHVAQYAGILICCAGFGVVIASDQVRGADYVAANALKGNLFILLAATMYGVTNVLEEFFVSKRPVYEVLGQLSFWAMFIIGVQAAIFDRAAFQSAVWSSKVGGYLTGYTILLFIFYSLAPIIFRMASAAFFNIGLLTGSFYGTAIGVGVFGYSIHWMYPIAFVLILIGFFVYYGTEGVLGDAKKPWLGENQEQGWSGIGTAKRRMENPNVVV